MTGRARPINKLANAAAQCTAEASKYGKCIIIDYNSVHKDKCFEDFRRLKNCYIAALRRAK